MATLDDDIRRLRAMGIQPFQLEEMGPSTRMAAKLLIGETIMAAMVNFEDPLLAQVVGILMMAQGSLDRGDTPESVIEYVTSRFGMVLSELEAKKKVA